MVDLADARSFRVLVFADVPGWEPVLRAYVESFDPGTDVSLVLAAATPAGLDEDAVIGAITALVEGDLGRSLEAIPDVILRPAPMAPGSARGCTARSAAWRACRRAA